MEDAPYLEPPSPEPIPDEPSKPWGAWATLGLGILIAIGWVVIQSIIAIAMVVSGFAIDSSDQQAIQYDGDLLGAATTGSGIAAIFLVLFFIWIRNHPVSDYLALRLPQRSWLQFSLWIGICYLLTMIYGLLAPIFEKEEIPEFMRQAYNSTDYPILLWVGIAVMAPLFEEIFFRGFIHAGWRRSALRWLGTALLTSFLWTIIHLQYGWFELSWIFILGLILSAAREVSKSLWVPIAMHAFNNALATYATEVAMAKEVLDSVVP